MKEAFFAMAFFSSFLKKKAFSIRRFSLKNAQIYVFSKAGIFVKGCFWPCIIVFSIFPKNGVFSIELYFGAFLFRQRRFFWRYFTVFFCHKFIFFKCLHYYHCWGKGFIFFYFPGEDTFSTISRKKEWVSEICGIFLFPPFRKKKKNTVLFSLKKKTPPYFFPN